MGEQLTLLCMQGPLGWSNPQQDTTQISKETITPLSTSVCLGSPHPPESQRPHPQEGLRDRQGHG